MSGDLSPIMRGNIFGADGVGIGFVDVIALKHSQHNEIFARTTERDHVIL